MITKELQSHYLLMYSLLYYRQLTKGRVAATLLCSGPRTTAPAMTRREVTSASQKHSRGLETTSCCHYFLFLVFRAL